MGAHPQERADSPKVVKMATLVAALNAKMVQCQAANAMRQAKLGAAWSEINDNLAPNIDNNGRAHAPCDGYRDFLDGDKLYQKGQFIATFDKELAEHLAEMEGRELRKPDYTQTIKAKTITAFKVEADSLNIQKVNYGIVSIGYGNSWDENGLEVCYMYIKHNKATYARVIAEYAVSALEAAKTTATTVEVPEWKAGRQIVTAQLVNVKVNMYDQAKALLKLEDGRTLYGNCPQSMLPRECVNRVFTFSVDVVVSEKDSSFAFLKRPTKIQETTITL